MRTKPLTKANLNEPVTAHLRQDFTQLSLEQNAGEALTWLRAHPPQGRVIYFYVVDGDGRLCGVVPARRLILAAPDTPLADIMVRSVVALPAEATVLDACEFFIQHRLLAFPVLDAEHRMLGTLDVELYADELWNLGNADERDELFQRVGLHIDRGRQASPWAAFRQRFPWLGCNLAAGIAAALLSGAYERELSRVVALAFFIPVVLNLAESVSSQSVSLALHAPARPGTDVEVSVARTPPRVRYRASSRSWRRRGRRSVGARVASPVCLGHMPGWRHHSRCRRGRSIGPGHAHALAAASAGAQGGCRSRCSCRSRHHHHSLLLQPGPLAAGLVDGHESHNG